MALTRETSNKVIPAKKYEVIKALEELKMSLDTFYQRSLLTLMLLAEEKNLKPFKVKIAEN